MQLVASLHRRRAVAAVLVTVLWLIALRPTQALAQHILVSSDFSDSVAMYDLNGNFVRHFVPPGGGGLDSPQGIAVGPDGHVYVSSAINDKVLKYHGVTGEFLGAVVDGGALDRPWYLTFGPDRNLYVSSSANSRVLCYNPQSGALIRIAAQGGGLIAPDGLSFRPDGMLLVSQFVPQDSRIKVYNPLNGAFDGDLVDDDNLIGALESRLSANGNELFVSSFGSNSIRRYNANSGAFLGTFATGPLQGPVGQLLHPDGTLLVSSWNDSTVYRFDATTGASLGIFARTPGFLDRPNNMTLLIPEPASAVTAVATALIASSGRVRRRGGGGPPQMG